MGSEFRLHLKRDSLALSRRFQERDQVYTFARDGRPISLFDGGDFYQRGLNNAWLHKGRMADASGFVRRFRRPLPAAEAEARLREIYADVSMMTPGALTAEAQAAIKNLLHWTPERLQAEGQRFAEIYQPISILPPDQYLGIVTQLTIGCSYNLCHFCNFYKDRRFRIKSPDEFAQHLIDVKSFLGDLGALRKGIFLADGDALMTPQRRLLGAIELLRAHWPELPLYSFMDAFRPQAKSLEQWRELQQRGLKRVYLGIESADPGLLAFLNKPGSPELMRSECEKLKAAGLSLGLIFMIGAGGQNYARQHFEASVALLQSLPLDRGDLIFLSEFVPHPDQPYFTKAQQAGIVGFSEAALQDEVTRWRGALNDLPARRVPYHLQEFIY